MKKRYAASVYSQKSTASAKSGRSFLSMTVSGMIWPSLKEDDTGTSTIDETKYSLWKQFKNWMPATKSKKPKKPKDTLSLATSASVTSSASSVTKLKNFLNGSPLAVIKLRSNPTTLPGQDQTIVTSSPSSSTIQEDVTTATMTTATQESMLDSSSTTGDKSTNTAPGTRHTRGGILMNRDGDSAELIAERKRKRRERRQHLLRLQQVSYLHSSPVPSADSSRRVSNDDGGDEPSVKDELQAETPTSQRRRHVYFGESVTLPFETSSSSTLLSTPVDEPSLTHPDDDKDGDLVPQEDKYGLFNPRVTFVEPSPVPRFRNVAPAPPPSPPYLHVVIPSHEDSAGATHPYSRDSIIADTDTVTNDPDAPTVELQPTVFTTLSATLPSSSSPSLTEKNTAESKPGLDETAEILSLVKQLPCRHFKRPKLCFLSPLRRGQTLTFSLENVVPEDHVIVYKFLTSNAHLSPLRNRRRSSASSTSTSVTLNQFERKKRSSFSSTWSVNTTAKEAAMMERYFVRPSAGRMVADHHTDIMLFLNQVPPLNPGEVLKDKIIVRWAVIQRNTQVDRWVQNLSESTRRKWLEMVAERWPDQVVLRETKIKIRFV